MILLHITPLGRATLFDPKAIIEAGRYRDEVPSGTESGNYIRLRGDDEMIRVEEDKFAVASLKRAWSKVKNDYVVALGLEPDGLDARRAIVEYTTEDL